MSKKKHSPKKRVNKQNVNILSKKNQVPKSGSIHHIICSIRDVLIGMYASEFFGQPFHDFHWWLFHWIKAMLS